MASARILRDQLEQEWGGQLGNSRVESLIRQGTAPQTAARQFAREYIDRQTTARLKSDLNRPSREVGPPFKDMIRQEIQRRTQTGGGSDTTTPGGDTGGVPGGGTDETRRRISQTLKDQEHEEQTKTEGDAELTTARIASALERNRGQTISATAGGGAAAQPAGAITAAFNLKEWIAIGVLILAGTFLFRQAG